MQVFLKEKMLVLGLEFDTLCERTEKYSIVLPLSACHQLGVDLTKVKDFAAFSSEFPQD